MAACAYCGTTILFGGLSDGDLRFCNEECRERGFVAALCPLVPDDVVEREVRSIHAGPCPECGGRGPVDVHTSYRVLSAIVFTSWSSRPHVACESCGAKAQVGDAALSLLLGWWGFPWGLIMTPVQVVRNVVGLVRGPAPEVPSPGLEHLVRLHLAAAAVEGGAGAEG